MKNLLIITLQVQFLLPVLYFFQEAHILHKFGEDFYGSDLKVVILGYLRQMTSFTTLGIIQLFFFKF